MRKLLILLLSTSMVFGQGGRPPIDKYSQLSDVDVTGLNINNIMVWNGTVWVPGTASTGGGGSLPSIAGQSGKFLTNDGTTIFWDVPSFASLSGKPTTAAGYGITNGANIDTWGAKTPFAGSLTIASGKLVAFANSVSFIGVDGASLNVGSGGTLGSNAFSSVAFVLQTTTINGHSLSSNVTVTKSDLGLGYLFSGAGSPEGAITAPLGSQYNRTDGGVGTSVYIKQTGSGNTGWTAAGAGGAGSLPTGGTVGQVLVKNSSTDFDSSWAADPGGAGGGGGTVLDVGVTTGNGVSATTVNATDHPRMTFSLGNITPINVGATGTVTGTNLSGTNTGDQTITLTGPVTGTGTGSFGTSITNNAVTLGKIATIPTNTILGNTNVAIDNPKALLPSEAKTVMSLDQVENTKLSTWTGSTSITTVGNLVGSPPNSSVAFSMLPVGTTNTTVAVGNDSRFTAALASQSSFGNSGSTTTPAPWVVTPNPKTVMFENTASPGLTAHRFSTLPAANLYAPGTILTYYDDKTTGNFGRQFHPAGTDTLNGLTATLWGANWLAPFIAGGSTTYPKSVNFKTDGTGAWVALGSGIVDHVEDPNFANKRFTFSAALQQNVPTPVVGLVTAAAGNSVTVSPTDNTIPGMLFDINTDGTVTKRPPNPTDVVPSVFPVGSAGLSIPSPATFPVTDTGPGNTIDTIFIDGTLTGPITIKLPLAAHYNPAFPLTIIDGSGSVNSTNPVTIATTVPDSINDTATNIVFDEQNGKWFMTSDGVSNWYIPKQKTSNFPVQSLTGVSGVFTLIPNSSVAGAQKAHMVLANGANVLIVPTPFDGMTIDLILVQPASGAAATLGLPTVSNTVGNTGLITLSSTNGTTDRLKGMYDGTINEFVWEAPVLNIGSGAPPNGAPDTLAVASFTGTTINLTWVDHATNEYAFDLERSNDSGATFSRIGVGTGTLGANANSYGDTGLTPGQPYMYKVRAQNSGGYSAFSSTVSQTTTPACSTIGDSVGLGTGSGTIFASNNTGTTANTYLASSFVASATTACRIETAMFYTGSPVTGEQFQLEIRDNNAGQPAATAHYTSSTTNSSGAISSQATTASIANGAPLSWPFSGVSLTVGQTYWVVVHSMGTPTFSTGGKAPSWNVHSEGTVSTFRSGDGVNWTPQGNNQKNWVKTYH